MEKRHALERGDWVWVEQGDLDGEISLYGRRGGKLGIPYRPGIPSGTQTVTEVSSLRETNAVPQSV